VFSYGLYLIHQPYVIYFGERMRWMSLYEFVVAACPIIALLAIFSARLEQYVNRLVNLVLKDKAHQRPPRVTDSSPQRALGGGGG
jgi:peptidoglycan/LPS O-acetylase OafA/YrhL